MILYICSNQNINLFDFLDKEQSMPIKKMSGLYKLKQFVIHDVRNLSQFEYFIIDLKALKDNETEIIEAITAFGTMYSARIIIFAEGLASDCTLISKLIDIKQYNIITSIDFEEIKEEMLECISSTGKDLSSIVRRRYFPKEEIQVEKKSGYSFLCRDIKVAVVGVSHKVGTTTTAFNLVNFLAASSAKAAYVEANTNEHLKCLTSFYKDMYVTKAYVEYKDVKYYFSGNYPEENNFNVIDFGDGYRTKIQVLKQCEVVILCATAKPYEIDFVHTAMNALDNLTLNIVLSHVPDKERKLIQTAIERKNSKIFFADYSADLFDERANSNIFKEILKEYMQPECDV